MSADTATAAYKQNHFQLRITVLHVLVSFKREMQTKVMDTEYIYVWFGDMCAYAHENSGRRHPSVALASSRNQTIPAL